MEEPAVIEMMDVIEQHAESTLELLAVLQSAQMMQVTREAILASLEEERRQERERFQALHQMDGTVAKAAIIEAVLQAGRSSPKASPSTA